MDPVQRTIWVTGRKHYQDALARLGAGLHDVALAREPDNPWDQHAVRVDALSAEGPLKVGYIPTEIAEALSPVLAEQCPDGTGRGRISVFEPKGRKQWAALLTHAGVK